MNRRKLFSLLPAAAAALALPGLALAACAPKRFPWPGSTQAAANALISETSLLDNFLEFGQHLDEADTPASPGRYIILTPADVVKVNQEMGAKLFSQPTYDYEPLGYLDRFKVYGTITEQSSVCGYDAKCEAGQRVKTKLTDSD